MAKSSGGSIIASVFISLIVVGAGIYFGLPLLWPNINSPTYQDNDLIRQVTYKEWKSQCFIWDSQITPIMMNETSMLVTTSGNSKLSIEFSTLFLWGISSSFDTGGSFDFVHYNISIVIGGVGNYTVGIEIAEPNNGEWSSMPFYLKKITPTLSAGTYNVSMYWYSTIDANGPNWLSANHANNYLYNTRLLYIEEIANI